MSRSYSTVAIVIGFLLFFAAILDARDHFGLWSAFSIMLGLFSIMLGASFGVSDKRQKQIARRVSLGFLGAALVFLAIALAIEH